MDFEKWASDFVDDKWNDGWLIDAKVTLVDMLSKAFSLGLKGKKDEPSEPYVDRQEAVKYGYSDEEFDLYLKTIWGEAIETIRVMKSDGLTKHRRFYYPEDFRGIGNDAMLPVGKVMSVTFEIVEEDGI